MARIAPQIAYRFSRPGAATLAAALLALAGCAPSDSDRGPGGVTVGEARALDAVVERLERRHLPAEILAPNNLAPNNGQSEDAAGDGAKSGDGEEGK